MKLYLLILVLTSLPAFGQAEPRQATLAQQKTCAEEARKAFKEYSEGYTAEFTSHYDARMHVCYVLVHRYPSSKAQGWSEVVLDAIERRQYAYIQWVPRENKQYWEVPPLACNVKPIGGDKKLCNSPEEFDALVEKYFGLGKVQN